MHMIELRRVPKKQLDSYYEHPKPKKKKTSSKKLSSFVDLADIKQNISNFTSWQL